MARNLRYAPTTATVLSASTDAGQKSDIPTTDIDSAFSFTIPALGTKNGGESDLNGDEVYEGKMNDNITYDATYYSWHTATAGTGTGSMASGWATSSICPRNWRLPTGGDGTGTTDVTVAGKIDNLTNGDFRMLDIAFGGDGVSYQEGGIVNFKNTIYGMGLTFSGRFKGNTADLGGRLGYWWTSSVYSGPYAWAFRLYQEVIYWGDNWKGDSNALRCVAR